MYTSLDRIFEDTTHKIFLDDQKWSVGLCHFLLSTFLFSEVYSMLVV